jgi:hypothetical protein
MIIERFRRRFSDLVTDLTPEKWPHKKLSLKKAA